MAGIETQVALEKIAKVDAKVQQIIDDAKKTAKPFTMVKTLEYSEPALLIDKDEGFIYDTIELIAPSSNSGTVYVGSDNPQRPISAGSSCTFRKKTLKGIYVRGTVGDQIIVSA